MLSCAYSSTIGSRGTIVGANANVYFKGYMDLKHPEYNLGFLNFCLFSFPIVIILLVLTWAVLVVIYLPKEFSKYLFIFTDYNYKGI